MALIFIDRDSKAKRSAKGKLRKPKKKVSPDFRKILESIANDGRDCGDVFRAFVGFAACALACGTREEEYMQEVKRWGKEYMNKFSEAFAYLIQEMESRPYVDVLGVHYMDWGISKASATSYGAFFTPTNVCDLMAGIGMSEEVLKRVTEEGELLTVSDPCVGSGATLLALAKHLVGIGGLGLLSKLRVLGIDINIVACNMCYVNTTLWGYTNCS